MQFPTLLIPSDLPTREELTSLTSFSRIENNPDIMWLTPLEDKVSISIDQVHELTMLLAYKPVAESYKVAIIAPADRLTLPAQQALLKTLEEPPENTQMILATSLPAKLLPTILSRAIISKSKERRITDKERKPDAPDYSSLQTYSLSACLKLSDTLGKDRQDAIETLRGLLHAIRDESHKRPSTKILADEKAVITCIEQLDRNAHMKLALDHLFFHIASHTLPQLT